MMAGVRGRTIAVTVTTTVVAVIAGQVVGLVLGGRNGVPALDAIAGTAVVVAFLAVGAVLTVARPANRVGRLLLLAAACWAVSAAAIEAGVYGLRTAPGSVPHAALLAVTGDAIRAAGWVVAVVAVAVVFPDGHLAGRRWRWLGRLVATVIGMLVVAEFIQPTIEETRLDTFRNPTGLPPAWDHATSLLALTGTGLTAVAVGGAVAQLVSRWRAGAPLVRQQLLAFTVAICVPVLVPLGLIVGGPPPWLFDVTVLPLPIAIAVAVLQHRLHDLHFAVNRTLLWLGLTGAVVAMYALVIGGVGGLLDISGARWLPWLATAVVAVSFAPLRSTLQSAVNRITYGRWEQPYDVLADLGQRLEAAADTGRLLDSVADELTGGLGLPGVRITDGDGSVLVRRGEIGDQPVRVPLIAYGATVGALLYSASARPPRPGDARLLEDLARQLGGVLHARRLVTELNSARERLVLAREEERRRLRRDLHDGVGPALAGLILKVDTIANLMPADAAAERARLRALRDDVQATVLDVRRVVEGLRPPALDELGLAAALQQATARLAADAGLPLSIRVDAPLPALPAAVEVSAYRIAVEAVTNVVRHAGAGSCTVSLACTPTGLTVTVADDGSGVQRSATGGGHGLATMRERAEELGGSLSITSSPGGTRVVATLPFAAPALEVSR